MTDTTDTPVNDIDPDASVQDLLEEADTLPCGPAERALLDEALRRAEAAGDEEAAYATRMRLTQSAHMTGDTDAMFSSFGWCVGKHDADPERFPITVDGCDLLFQYKWMAGRLSTNPTFSLAQIEAMHEDMRARYAAAGATMSGVVQSQFHIATVTGRLDEAAAFLERRSTIEDDRYSHCEACVRNEDAWFHQLRGHDDDAIRIYDEMFENRMSCGEEPETSEAQALLPYLRAGRFDDAKAAHQRSYRVARSNADGFGIIADHLVFCAVTGNEARGLAMLERHLPALVNDPINLSGHADGLIAVGVLLDAVARAGHGDLPVRGADAPDLARYLGTESTDAADWTVSAVAARAWAAAEHLTRAFDERNGNGFRTERLEAARALATEHWDLPLSVEGSQPRSPSRNRRPRPPSGANGPPRSCRAPTHAVRSSPPSRASRSSRTTRIPTRTSAPGSSARSRRQRSSRVTTTARAGPGPTATPRSVRQDASRSPTSRHASVWPSSARRPRTGSPSCSPSSTTPVSSPSTRTGSSTRSSSPHAMRSSWRERRPSRSPRNGSWGSPTGSPVRPCSPPRSTTRARQARRPVSCTRTSSP